MQVKGSVFFSILVVVLLIGAYYPTTKNADKEAILIHTILGGLDQMHYNPQDINDEFSEKVYDLYIERLDGAKRWLTKEDLAVLDKYKHKIDDEANEGTYEFFNTSLDVMDKAVAKTADYYKDILDKPFDFTKDETMLDSEDRSHAKNDKELKAYWVKVLKYQVMGKLADKLKAQEKSEEEEEKNKSLKELEEDARADVLKSMNDTYTRIGKLRRTDRLSNYLNAVTNIFDPHTGYFEPKDKETFDINMSGSLEGIGARLQTDGEYTKVTEIIPGGPAWKGKDLEPNDLIMKVAQGKDEPVDVMGNRIDDVVKLIRGKKGTEVRLTVKKVDGSVDVIEIIRDVVIIDESYAKSVILDFPGKAENIGYIKLPRFYADFNGTTGRSCATDIRKEIEKLKDQNVNGIILDLRNNGGGSLRDVVKMSGYFIEEGPIVQVKARHSSPEILADTDSKVQYKGNLIVMVNSFSASASEILAAALQDYGRAVIVGSNSTFGKGTVQRFFDLDSAIRGFSDIKPLGEVKLTIQKFYRINGGSTQLKGVTPDIILPDNYHYIKTGEEEHEFAMQWTKIDAVDYNQNVYKLSKERLDELKLASEKRVASNPLFQKIDDNAKRLKELRDKDEFTLNLSSYQAQEAEQERISEEHKESFKEIEGLKVNNLEVDMEYIKTDESRVARNDEWVTNIKKDIYIDEVLSIMADMQ